MIRTILALIAVVTLTTAATPAPSGSPRPVTRPAKSPAAAPSAAESSNAAPASFDLGVWTVHASSLDANFKTGDFSTPDRVVMTRNGGDVTADRANGNYKKQLLYLNGHVVVHDTQGSVASVAGAGAPHSPSPSTLTADRAEIDGAAKTYKAIGDVHYVQADTVVNADNGTLNDAAHTLLLEGGVHITQGTRSMTAHRVLYNTVTGTAHAQGDVTMQFPSELHRGLATPRPLKFPGSKSVNPNPSAAP